MFAEQFPKLCQIKWPIIRVVEHNLIIDTCCLHVNILVILTNKFKVFSHKCVFCIEDRVEARIAGEVGMGEIAVALRVNLWATTDRFRYRFVFCHWFNLF